METPLSLSVPREDPCYWCGDPSSSDEHVPPKCLFPERKDVPEVDLRVNLLTVRSCDLHNQRKSKDDEFLMAILAPIVGNNSIGYLQTQTKLARALERRKGSLGAAAYREPEPFIGKIGGVDFPLSIVKGDTRRIIRALESVARGVYRLHFGSRFHGRCVVFPDFLDYSESPKGNVLKGIVRGMARSQAPDWPEYATNPDVFSYKVGPVDEFGLTPMMLRFYEGAIVWVAFMPHGVNALKTSIKIEQAEQVVPPKSDRAGG